MRTLSLIIAGVLVLAVRATPRPLVNKEIALMLRAGFSSEAVLAEVANRHTLESLDANTRKSLLEFGASSQLINALESGVYAASATEVDQAKTPPPIAARPTPVPPSPPPAGGVTPAPNEGSLMRDLRGKLVLCRDGAITPADDSALEQKKLIAFYFSAHWCGPCRKFTPQLVDYYSQIEPQHPEFAIIFVSCDRSRFNWETYMRDTKMPWLAIDYDRLGDLGPLRRIGGSGIPSLVLVDAGGRILSNSFEGGNYLGPQKVIADLNKIFAAIAQSPLAQLP